MNQYNAERSLEYFAEMKYELIAVQPIPSRQKVDLSIKYMQSSIASSLTHNLNIIF